MVSLFRLDTGFNILHNNYLFNKKMKKILREPLLHFILIGAVLFIITGWVNTKTSEAGKRRIYQAFNCWIHWAQLH
jgi:hypothetical protein